MLKACIVLITLMIMMMITIQCYNVHKYKIIKHVYNTNSYVIYEINDLLTKDECKLIMDSSKDHLKRSSVMSSKPVSNVRTSENTFLKLNNYDKSSDIYKLLDKIDIITLKISGKNRENQEPLQVVKYEPSQYYNEHYDCCVPMESSICKRDTELHGLRYATLLIYLNDVEERGETNFPLLKTKFKPKMGNAVFFYNLTPDEKKYHILSKHAGLAPIKGTKWVCNKWIRTKRYT